MAPPNAARSTNFYYNPSGATTFNVNFGEATVHHMPEDSQSHREKIISSCHTTFPWLVSGLINLLQLKYQGKSECPFDTRPKTMFVAVSSLLMYCLAYDAKLKLIARSRASDTFPKCYYFCCRIVVAIFCPICLVSILSLLFSDKFGPLLYTGAVIYSFSEFPRSGEFKDAWIWLQSVAKRRFNRRQRNDRNGSISVVFPWLTDQQLMIGQVDYHVPV